MNGARISAGPYPASGGYVAARYCLASTTVADAENFATPLFRVFPDSVNFGHLVGVAVVVLATNETVEHTDVFGLTKYRVAE